MLLLLLLLHQQLLLLLPLLNLCSKHLRCGRHTRTKRQNALLPVPLQPSQPSRAQLAQRSGSSQFLKRKRQNVRNEIRCPTFSFQLT